MEFPKWIENGVFHHVNEVTFSMYLGYLRLELVARGTNFLFVRLELSVPPWKGRGLEIELISNYKVVVQLPSCVQLFVTPWTVAHQTSLSITNSWSLLKLVSIKSVITRNN